MGIVPPSAYQPLREEIADRFLQCVTDDGHPIAERVVLASAPPSMEWPDTGPDLTIHWSEHALMNRPLRTLSPPVEGDAAGGDLTAVHEDRGFVIARGARSASHENEPLMPEDLGAEVCRVLDRTEEHAAVVQRNRASHLSRSLESRFFRSDFRPDRLERQG
ncbi:MAG TPA: hypothetical protein VM534_01715 [Thermoanaerobaculia bacterium]|nr:hypothetical protein [Thermoanaerobaculia bacterium]